MDESYKHDVEQKKLDAEYTLWFLLYEVQKHIEFIYVVRNQATGYPFWEVVTGRGHKGGFRGAGSVLFGVLIWLLIMGVPTLWKFSKVYT